MKKLIMILMVITTMTSCKSCFTSYAEMKAGVNQVCPSCTFVRSESDYYAVDTAKRPNIIYKVRFKGGGLYYKASDVDELIRVN